MRTKLTRQLIRDAVPKADHYIIWDTTVTGLGLKVFPSGTKSFVIAYRSCKSPNPKAKRLATIGRPPALGLAQARRQASLELTAIRAGNLGLAERRDQSRHAPTLNEVLDRFFDEYAPHRISIGRLTQNTARQYRLCANAVVRPNLGHFKVSDIRRTHVEEILIDRPPTARNRDLAFLSRIFTLCEHWEHRPQHSNPCFAITRSVEHPRDRTLSTSELAALNRSLDQFRDRYPAPVDALRFACYTGLRIGEITAIQWQHLDSDTSIVRLPSTKTGQRRHYLPAPALQLLEAIPRQSDWVFTTGTRPISYSYLRKCFARIASHAGLEDIRIHDIRRTVITRAASSGVSAHILRDMLGHRTAQQADRYIRNVGGPRPASLGFRRPRNLPHRSARPLLTAAAPAGPRVPAPGSKTTPANWPSNCSPANASPSIHARQTSPGTRFSSSYPA